MRIDSLGSSKVSIGIDVFQNNLTGKSLFHLRLLSSTSNVKSMSKCNTDMPNKIFSSLHSSDQICACRVLGKRIERKMNSMCSTSAISAANATSPRAMRWNRKRIQAWRRAGHQMGCRIRNNKRCRAVREEVLVELEEKFNLADGNSSGKLDVSEVRHLLECTGERYGQWVYISFF